MMEEAREQEKKMATISNFLYLVGENGDCHKINTFDQTSEIIDHNVRQIGVYKSKLIILKNDNKLTIDEKVISGIKLFFCEASQIILVGVNNKILAKKEWTNWKTIETRLNIVKIDNVYLLTEDKSLFEWNKSVELPIAQNIVNFIKVGFELLTLREDGLLKNSKNRFGNDFIHFDPHWGLTKKEK